MDDGKNPTKGRHQKKIYEINVLFHRKQKAAKDSLTLQIGYQPAQMERLDRVGLMSTSFI